jgi:hypothetical protein
MDSKNGFDMQTWSIDYDYIKTMGMKLLKEEFFQHSGAIQRSHHQ